jgi:hypothetical protein
VWREEQASGLRDHRIRTNVREVVLKDGTRIPPHGKIDTFVLVKQGDAWRIAAMNIHNQMPRGRERPGERVPLPTKQPPESNAR